MKKSVVTLGITNLLIISSQGAIVFSSGATQHNVAPLTEVVYTGDPSADRGTNFDGVTELGSWEGITMTMTSSIQGDWFIGASPTFRTDTALNPGDTVTFTAESNILLQGGIRADDVTGFPGTGDVSRAAAALNTGTATGALEITMTGGPSTLFDYFTGATGLFPGTENDYYRSGDSQSFYDGRTGLTFMDGTYSQTGSNPVTQFPTVGAPNTIEVDGNGGSWVLLSSERTAGAAGLAFTDITWEFQVDAAVPAGSFFNFSFEGGNVPLQLAMVPEPSSGVLAVLGLGSLAFARKRRRAKS